MLQNKSSEEQFVGFSGISMFVFDIFKVFKEQTSMLPFPSFKSIFVSKFLF
jgi:hypothetical protein